MKKLFILTVASFFIFSGLAFGANYNLLGLWNYSQKCVRIGTDYNHGDFIDEVATIEIIEQQGDLFFGRVYLGEVPNQNFYGAIDGKNVYFTFWDGFANGKINKKGDEINFVSQNPLDNEPNAPATCIGTATKTSK